MPGAQQKVQRPPPPMLLLRPHCRRIVAHAQSNDPVQELMSSLLSLRLQVFLSNASGLRWHWEDWQEAQAGGAEVESEGQGQEFDRIYSGCITGGNDERGAGGEGWFQQTIDGSYSVPTSYIYFRSIFSIIYLCSTCTLFALRLLRLPP